MKKMPPVSSQQLAMFMTPQEIAKNVNLGDRLKNETPKQTLKRKQEENETSGLGAAIKSEGVKKPVNIYHNEYGMTLEDGHHRVAAALQHNPHSLIPVWNTTEKEGWWTLPEDHDSDWYLRGNKG